jgi:hypothetical protein
VGIPCYPSSTVEYVPVPVTGTYTTDTPVAMAVVPYGIEPDADDYHDAAWDNGYAKVKIGAGSDVGQLDEGMYGVWVKVTAADEEPVMKAGPIRVT